MNMKKYITSLLAALLPFCVMAEKKVSKIYRLEDETVQELSYDEQGRLESWKEYYKQDVDDPDFDLRFNYIEINKVVLSGTIEGDTDRTMEVTLNDDNLVVFATENRNESCISCEYENGILSKISWWCTDYPEDKAIHFFQIENGNPIKLSGYWDYSSIKYSEIPNKCGLVYLPMITCNTAWDYRALAYAGLFGHGSRTLPSACSFYPDEPLGIVDYTLDSDGYILTMKVTNGNDGDGYYTFEYTDVNGLNEIETTGSEIKVYYSGGQVVVDGEYSRLAVYNLQGSECVNSNLENGIYIVDVDNKRFKVLVQ